MRILMTTQSAPSHLRAVVPTAQAFCRRGHELVVALPAALHPEVASYGLRAVTVSPDWPEQTARACGRRSRQLLPSTGRRCCDACSLARGSCDGRRT
jgi:hypothetical protein